ncbi:MAG: NfeD family protein [Alphaproteobacteria bacterium]|nr:NfeD family protein [Alphaproteobacteria bacterium]
MFDLGIATHWEWMSIGVFFMILEVITPGVFFIWIGVGAVLTGLLSLIFGIESFYVLGLVFAVLSGISVWLGRKIMKKKQADDNSLNNRGGRFLGQVYNVAVDIVNGRGKINIDDSQWLVICETDVEAGKKVKVVSIDGTTLKVEPVE